MFEYEIQDLVFYRIVVWLVRTYNEVVMPNLLYVLRKKDMLRLCRTLYSVQTSLLKLVSTQVDRNECRGKD